jgi:hypothetical protein
MPVLRHDLLRLPGDHEFLMAFIEIPSLRVVPRRERYTHLAADTEADPAMRSIGTATSKLDASSTVRGRSRATCRSIPMAS